MAYHCGMPTIVSSPTVIDLYSGVGGLSLGAARAGFRVAASVELDPIAAAFHAINFPGTTHLRADVAALNGRALLAEAGLALGGLHGLIGGPPCQGFSTMGRNQASDPRNDLFRHFFRLVGETRPAFYLAENVPGILAPRNLDKAIQGLGDIPDDYIQLPPIRVEANRYGAPTTRTRIFFLGYDPTKLSALDLPAFLPQASTQEVKVKQAIAGLPRLRSDWQREEQSWRRVAALADSDFGRRAQGTIPPGVGHPDALRRFEAKGEVSGFLGTLHSEATVARFSKLKQGEVDQVYRSPRLKLDGFCPTLRAGTGSDRGSYQAVRPIHPTASRVISPREAARLQGFPDWFVFHPTKWHSFRQIGNSVSPLVAERMLAPFLRHLR